MKRIIFCLVAMMSVLTMTAQSSVYDFTVKDDAGKDVSLAEYKGKVLLIVNTATRCGFTPQYKELEALYEKYQAEGFEILDFPCNQFGEQAPGTIREIHQFCTANFDIQFPQFDKIEVNGVNEHPLYTFLKAQKGFGGFDTNDQRGKMMDNMLRKRDANYDKNADIKWNFTKFLISRDGRVLKRYEPTENISNIEADMQMEVNPVLSNIMARRSIRKYLDKPVEHAKLEAVALAGTYGCGSASCAAMGAWKKCYAQNKPAPFQLLIFAGAPLSQTIYGMIVMFIVMGGAANVAAATAGQWIAYSLVGILAGIAMGVSALWQGISAAAACDAFAETGKGFANQLMALGIVETVAIFVLAFSIVLLSSLGAA